ncbi:FAD-dependent oxidoreductase [Prosthecomicrobium pneumaticum]|uniref:Glycerol-3-phosphate dehydrogenase n=1 Tax=Prosthecomicrobium pneumaticum TaxID=81895 RepID=A0A7W9CTL3_9HYPH|nr:FAD-dependent oxidoreductase [Prosthecomicrobium pneumaticum]MBB5751419.1 glycerol-3-phosphate dehydrogenase [Prosthecomicrobium pneumaticum]
MTPAGPVLDRVRMTAEIAADDRFDVVVVGGGITGAGTFRDLALQGLRVLLVEAGDFASGASGALSRVAHGGFRYLERGDIGLVRDAVRERDRLVAAAPHAVRPIRVVIPLTSRFGGLLAAPLRFFRLASGRGLPGVAPMALGVALYGALSGGSGALPGGGAAAGTAARRRFPYLGRRFAGAVWTHEGRIEAPERIAVELIEEGVAAGGRAAALNYCRLVAVEHGRLVLEDRLAGRSFRAAAEVVVNAAGAHADRVAGLFGIEQRMTGGVAGAHLILEAGTLAARLGDDLLFFEDGAADPAKRRLCVLYRLGGDRLLLGTTETRCDAPEAADVGEADRTYLLAALAGLFPDEASGARVVGHMVGVRPLVHSDEADLAHRSRDHAVFRHRPGGLPLVTIVGGKWTTFRKMAEDAADAALDALGRSRRVSTADRAIGGGANFRDRRDGIEADLIGLGLPPDLARRLTATYGTRAPRVARYVAAKGGAAPLSDDGRLTRGEVRFFATEEMATSAEDVVRRRSDQFFRAARLDTVTARVAAELGVKGGPAS